MQHRRMSCLLLATIICLGAPASHALRVPITVQELVPAGVPGRARTAEAISAGVPLNVEDGITDVGQLGFVGAPAAQFRILQRDRETQKATWVLVDFVASVPGNGYALVDGTGNFGGAALAVDQGTRIVVSTGVANFEIRKSGFNVLDRVLLGADELVGTHAGGGLVVTAGGARYESGLDTTSETAIEENGPVKTVVRARGVLRGAAGAPFLRYTVRLHFYKGLATCRAHVTLRNADLASLATRTFDAAWVEVPLRLDPQRQVSFGSSRGTLAGNVVAGQTAHLFQGDNTFQRGRNTDAILSYLTPTKGLEVMIAGALLGTAGSTADVARGWVRLQDGRHAVLAGMRDMATLFPSGFDLSGDLLSIELFSRYNPQKNLIFSWGAHETREILLQFALPGADPEACRYALQYPLFGRCDFERYRDTGAACGERRLVSVAEEQSFFTPLGKNWSVANYGEADVKLDRQYGFGGTGGPNQFDRDECELLDFLRSGYAGRLQQGRLGALWKADQAVVHSDDFDYGTRQNGVSDVTVTQPASFHGKGAGSTFDDEHPHWPCMLLYYHLTGDERVREAIEDYGEFRRYRAGNPTFGALYGGALQHFRLWSRCFRDVALLYEFTGQTRYLDDVRRMAGILTRTIEQGTSKGRNLDRGYFFFGTETDPLRLIHLFFLTEMNPIGVQEAMRVLPSNDPLKEELRDYLHGLAYFTLQEAQLSPSAIGYPYQYYSAVANTALGVRGDQTGILLTHGYEMSGDPEFVNRSRALAWRVLEYQHLLRGSELSTHLRIYRWLHRDEVGAALLDPQVRRNANGSYTLTWKAPAYASEYIVKYGPRPLVENLGFDQAARRYRIDPATAMNFWAATNLQGEPTPGAAGATETFTTPILPAGTWSFKVKAQTDARRPLLLPLGSLHGPAGGRGAQRVVGPPPGRGIADSLAREAVLAGPIRVTPMPSVLRRPAGVAFTRVPPGAVVRIYTVTGRLVRRLVADGERTLLWDRCSESGARVAPGVYLYRADMGPERWQRGRLILVP